MHHFGTHFTLYNSSNSPLPESPVKSVRIDAAGNKISLNSHFVIQENLSSLAALSDAGLADDVRLTSAGEHELKGLSGTHEVFNATWQRCRVHFARNAIAHAGRSRNRVVSALIATARGTGAPPS